jgi:hypothetical protein
VGASLLAMRPAHPITPRNCSNNIRLTGDNVASSRTTSINARSDQVIRQRHRVQTQRPAKQRVGFLRQDTDAHVGLNHPAHDVTVAGANPEVRHAIEHALNHPTAGAFFEGIRRVEGKALR